MPPKVFLFIAGDPVAVSVKLAAVSWLAPVDRGCACGPGCCAILVKHLRFRCGRWGALLLVHNCRGRGLFVPFWLRRFRRGRWRF